ncbi:MAG: hypothetical protein QOI06_3571 [Nocardioidaceae bacterium]|nr:hypothetical protein [Nocardioidaceae bacterium]
MTIAGNETIGTTHTATATCTTGKAISGGGTVAVTSGTGKEMAALSESKPTTTGTNPTGWSATSITVVSNPGGGTVTAYVVCG